MGWEPLGELIIATLSRPGRGNQDDFCGTTGQTTTSGYSGVHPGKNTSEKNSLKK